MPNETVLVAGAGIAGLGAALALSGAGRKIVLIDRDPPPPGNSPEEAFLHWERRGATQLRHSHAFLGRFTSLIRDRYPQLLKELLAEGARLLTYAEALPSVLEKKYRPKNGDEDLTLLFSRRATLEFVMRRHVAKLPGVTFVTDAGVRGPAVYKEDGKLIIGGLKVERDGATQTMRADIVIDAMGRNTLFPAWLRTYGVAVREETSPCGILYFTRHYRLREGQNEPRRDSTLDGGDLGYIKYAVCIADSRAFSITLAVPEIETEIRKIIMKPGTFDAIVMALPGVARWIARADPVTQVYSMGALENVWRHYLKDGEAQVLNFFALGDAAVRTNPLYGRGCSSGIVQAHILRAALDVTDDPAERARFYERELGSAMRRHFDSMVNLDRHAIRRAENERAPAPRPGLKAHIRASISENGLVPAQRAHVAVNRAISRVFHMLEEPKSLLRRPRVLARVLQTWAMPKTMKQARGYYPPKLGPERAELFAHLNLVA